MKTNYAEQLAWFEYSVKPHSITSSMTPTYCWHATKPRKPRPFVQVPQAQPVEEEVQSGSRKRRRVELSESPFLTTMDDVIEDDEEADQEEADVEMLDVVVNEIEKTPLDTAPMTTLEHSNTGIRRTMSSSSVETVYFDALEDIIIPTPNPPTIMTESASLGRIKDRFKLTKFIPNQRESIEAAVNGEDMLLILPAGPPRNLCYIAPISESQKTTIVIVPTLLYLMEQDDCFLSTYTIPYMFTSKSNTFKTNWISCDQLEKYCLNCIRRKKTMVSLLYMTCQEFTRLGPVLTKLYQNSKIERFVVDEAHCLSQWGQDFQFSYLRLAETLKQQFPRIPITAITAIPSERIHIDIMTTLRITCQVFKKSILL